MAGQKSLSLWLRGVYLSLLIMVCLGGITRLTGSGLSIVDWRPVTGAIPPLTQAAWKNEFNKYQSSPEFRLKNFQMGIGDFKKIFFWEYLHRLWGRLLGFFILVPAFFLARRGYFLPWLRRRLLFVLALSLLQGFMGWYMVKSGLFSAPHVSHYRLAMHFLLATFIICVIFWTLLEVRHGTKKFRFCALPIFLQLLSVLVLLQLTYGAFLAGTKAGFAYPTFPMMNGQWFPAGALDLLPTWLNVFENGIFIHWLHRLMGTLIFCAAWWQYLKLRHKAALAFALLTSTQFILGALTVLFSVPTALGVIHQLTALLLLSSLLVIHYSASTHASR